MDRRKRTYMRCKYFSPNQVVFFLYENECVSEEIKKCLLTGPSSLRMRSLARVLLVLTIYRTFPLHPRVA